MSEKFQVHILGSVNTDSVDAEFIRPVFCAMNQFSLHFGISQIERRQFQETGLAVYGKAVAAKVRRIESQIAIPASIRGILSLFLKVPVGKMMSGGMVPHGVKKYMETCVVEIENHLLQAFVIS